MDILPKYPYQQAWFPVVKEALLFQNGKDALHQQIKQSLAELYPVLLLNNKITNSQAES